MEKRFGDSVGQISVAATIFNPASSKLRVEDQMDKIRLLAEHFKLNKEQAANEWLCFRRYMDNHKDKTTADIFKNILVTGKLPS